MKKKPTIVISCLLALVIIACTFALYKTNVERSIKMRMEGVLGHSIFQVFSNYSSIEETAQPTINDVLVINEKLKLIEGYSDTIDSIVGTPLLQPIAINLGKVIDKISSNYYKNQKFSEEDIINYKTVLIEMKNVVPLLDKVYYVPSKPESETPKVKLKIKDFGEITELSNRVKKILESL